MSKNTTGQICPIMVCAALLGSSALYAQTKGAYSSGSSSTNSDQISQMSQSQDAPVQTDSAARDASTVMPDKSTTPDNAADSAPTIYVPAINGSGLIALDRSIRTRLLYGANYSSGYDSNPADLADAPGAGVYLISPFVGVESDAGTVQYVLQYQPSFRKYSGGQYNGGTLQTASLKVSGAVDERWQWNVQGNGSYGQDSIRLLAPQQSVAVGDVPGTGPGSASYRPDAGTITYIDGEAGMKYNATERDSIGLNLANSYSDYSDLVGNSIIATGTIAYTRSVTPKFQWINYGQGARYYGLIHCFSYGGGVGLEWKPNEHAYLHLSGGPQVDTSGCGRQQGYAYTADFSTRLSQRSQIYFTSSRQAASTYLGPGLWQKNVSVGFQHDFTKDQSLGVDFGYVGTTSLQGLMGYSGTYVDAGYSYRFSHSVSASLNFRRYAGDWTDTSFTRNTALVSVSWAPSSGHIFQ